MIVTDGVDACRRPGPKCVDVKAPQADFFICPKKTPFLYDFYMISKKKRLWRSSRCDLFKNHIFIITNVIKSIVFYHQKK